MAMLRVPVNSNDHIQGPDNAPVTLLEYGDYECPYCGRTNPVVRRVQRYFGPRLRFAYRHFPLTEIHQRSEAAAETAEYAGAYGRFWEAHDMLFENQDHPGLPLFSRLCGHWDWRNRDFGTLWRTALLPTRYGAISSAACAVA